MSVVLPPVWLLDVDGCLCASRPGWGSAPRAGTAYADGYPYRMRWAPALVARIRALHTAGSVTLRWCTTWCPQAEVIERLVGLPALPRAWTRPLPDVQATDAAKLDAAREVIAAGRRLIWTDDTAIGAAGAHADVLRGSGRALLIAPRSGRGLRPSDLDAVEAFIAGSAGVKR